MVVASRDATAIRPAPAPGRLVIGAFCFGTFAYWGALYVYSPVLSVYARTLGAGFEIVGLVVAAYGLPQLLFRIPLGIGSDVTRRRKPLILAGALLSALGAVLFLTATSPTGLIAGRIVHGFAAATWVLFTVLFASYYPPHESIRAMALMSAMSSIAQVVASLAGGVAAEAFGWLAPFWLCLALGIIGLAAMATVPEVRPDASTRYSTERLRTVAGVPLLIVVSIVTALALFASFSTSYGFSPVYAATIGANRADLGVLAMVTMIANLLGNVTSARLSEWLGADRIVAAGLLAFGISVLLVPLTSDLLAFGTLQAFTGLGRGLSYPVAMGLAVQAVRNEDRATAMGIFQAVYSVGMTVGPTITGVAAQASGLPAAFVLNAGVCFIATVLAIVGIRHTMPPTTAIRS